MLYFTFHSSRDSVQCNLGSKDAPCLEKIYSHHVSLGHQSLMEKIGSSNPAGEGRPPPPPYPVIQLQKPVPSLQEPRKERQPGVTLTTSPLMQRQVKEHMVTNTTFPRCPYGLTGVPLAFTGPPSSHRVAVRVTRAFTPAILRHYRLG